MNDELMKEAKLVTLAMAKLSSFCRNQEDCDQCPLSFGSKASNPCILNDHIPNSWDPDQALYRIGYIAGKGEK